MSAIISDCGKYRHRLERRLPEVPLHSSALFAGKTIAFFGINPSTADASLDDATVRKWRGFCLRWGASRFIVGNVFAYRATDVKALASVEDPFGAGFASYITDIIAEADILVPCWGNTGKAPKKWRHAFDVALDAMVQSGKPMRHFGLTNSGDPKHPLMLGYDTKLQEWTP